MTIFLLIVIAFLVVVIGCQLYVLSRMASLIDDLWKMPFEQQPKRNESPKKNQAGSSMLPVEIIDNRSTSGVRTIYLPFNQARTHDHR